MREVNDFIICDMPNNDELDFDEVEKIVEHTHNTWQKNRPVEEIRENTIQGKKAEAIVEKVLRKYSRYRYISYDSIRTDEFEKHAPFDGIIFSSNIEEEILNDSIKLINSDVRGCEGDAGILSATTRQKLEYECIYTVEIKSSLLKNPRDYKNMAHKTREERTVQDYENLCKYIKDYYDFFVYPYYCRDSEDITNFYRYTQYVRNNHVYNTVDKRLFLNQLMKDEFDNACILYTRVFFDVVSNEIIVPGYVLKTRFFEGPRIQKMPSPKSQNAIYYMYHMYLGKSFIDIDHDDELARYNRIDAYHRLLGSNQEQCVICGHPLKLVESKANGKFLYLCEKCRPQKWFTMKQIHVCNMNE